MLHVKQGRRYAAGVKVPALLPDWVIGTELKKSDALGWTNALVYAREESPVSGEGDYTHVIVATRSGPDDVIDLDAPPYAGNVVWARDAYPDMPIPGETPNVIATGDGGEPAPLIGTGESAATAAGVGIGLAALFLLLNYAV
jgi:hypothetical protein